MYVSSHEPKGPGNTELHGLLQKFGNQTPMAREQASCLTLEQRFPTFLTRGALFRINFYGGAP